MKYPKIRGYIRANVECDNCRVENSFLYRIGFNEDRVNDRVYCEDCRNNLFVRKNYYKELIDRFREKNERLSGIDNV